MRCPPMLLFIPCFLCSFLFLNQGQNAQAACVTLHFFDCDGRLLSADQTLAVMGGPKSWSTRALVHPVSLQNLKEESLLASGQGLAFTLLPNPAALIVNWPAVRGYSALILDNGGVGFQSAAVINFPYQAALDARRKLDLSRANRPAYVPSSSFNFHYHRAVGLLQRAASATDEAQKGKAGQLALNDLALATDLLLREYGIAFVRSRLSSQFPWIGFTLDTIDRYRDLLDLAKNIAGRMAWVRIVIDQGTPPATYVPAQA